MIRIDIYVDSSMKRFKILEMTAIIRKEFVFTVILLLAVAVNANSDQKQKYIPNEVIVFVTLKVNKNKSKEHIAEFTKKYSEFVDKTEPDSLGWSYHQSGEKVILIERYKNEDANIVTAKNISPGGNRYKLLQESFNYHTLGKVTVIGGFTQKLIDFNKMTAEKVGFTAPFVYYPLISGYSKNL